MTQFPQSFPNTRMRRLRQAPWVRGLVAENTLTPADLVWAVFIHDGYIACVYETVLINGVFGFLRFVKIPLHDQRSFDADFPGFTHRDFLSGGRINHFTFYI